MKERNTVSGFPVLRLFGLVIVLGVIAVADVGYGSNLSNDSTEFAVGTGVFLASPIQGLSFDSTSQSGVTDGLGAFSYRQGETVRFKVGDIVIGTAIAQSIITPLDLVPGARDHTHPSVTNIVRFLQTVDENNDPTDGIVVSEQVRTRALGKSLNFFLSETDFAGAAQAVIDELFGPKPPQLVNAQDAQNHLQAELLALANTTRDDKGVWFITQAGEEDMYSIFEAMGYAVATDRLWQAETYRRSARGKLAEVFGPSYLGRDILIRTIGYSDQELQNGFDALGDEEKAIINGYVAGFNRRIDGVRQDSSLLPFEFAELGVLPEDWTVLDILAWLALLQRDFDSNGYATRDQINNAVFYLELSEKFPADYADMFDDLRWINDPEALTYIPAVSQATSAEEKQTTRAEISDIPDLRSVADSMTTRFNNAVENLKKINAHVKMGSYAWSVGGAKTASGNPIIYSGPQMGFSVPSIVLEGSIRTDSLDISGMTVAGVPGIIIGRSPHHAWSMQVGEAHTVDYYFESPDAVSLNRQETIKVAGAEDAVVSIYRTAHGPVIHPFPYDPATYIPDPSNPIISWKYSQWGYEFDFVKSLLGLARATSMDEFGEAVEFLAVSHHFCYADRDGNIAYWMSGRDPVRPAGEWRFPQGFAASALEWDAATLIPRSTDRNSPQGFYCGWNNKTNPDYDNSFNSSWNVYGPFHRAHVIHDYLAAHDNLTFEDIRDLALNIATTDSLNGAGNPWKFVSGDFSAAVQADPTPERTAALSLLGNWDGHFVDGGESCWRSCADRSDSWMLMDAWTREVIRLTFGDELATATMTYAHQDRTLLFNVLLHGLAGGQSGVVNNYDWFQNSSDPAAPQTADAIIIKALDNVLDNLGDRPWGTNARGVIRYSHTMLGQVWTAPSSQRSTYAHCVEFAPWGPVRIESMFPLGESGDILVDLDGSPVFDPNFFSMAPVFDTFAHREFRPEISLNHSLLNNACEYGTDAPDQTFEIWNSGWVPLTYSVIDDVEWLTCSPESGMSTGEHDTITVNFSTSELNAGSYSATITISDPNAVNSPQHISVNLDVDIDTDADGILDSLDDDDDNDGMPDEWEEQYSDCVNPLVKDAFSDCDNDGYNNYVEYLGGTDPTDESSVPGTLTKRYSLLPGVNAIAFSLEDTGYTTAQALGQAITDCTAVARWDTATQSYETHVVGSGGEGFGLTVGEVYFVTVDTAGPFELTGLPPASLQFSLTTTLTTDFSAISLPYGMSDITTAEELALAIDGCEVVSRWDAATQSYQSHVVGFQTVNNFDVYLGEAYFVSVSENVDWP